MRRRDLVATVLVGALTVPYLVIGTGRDNPPADDLRAVVAISLMLGGGALVALVDDEYDDPVSWLATLLAAGATLSGLMALAVVERPAAPILLTVFVGLVAAVWAVQLAEHFTVRPPHRPERRSP